MKINIEEFEPGKIKKDAFYLSPIPWRWEVLDGSKVIGFGYTHTEEDANRMANQCLNDFKKPQYS